ncbi:hypothetical protein NHX12_027623 [Muraenolepis orangiensis]|uniref:Cytochrome P450 n=1 Tax=Muraenolepis orangiensis TaxID=630683 RepID=A0A9Q0IPE3_9TELE|nr:hypothetical protein NHX12_027623 [Muraenolepis orangiensis]
MAKLPGNPGYPVVGDKSLEFYKDPVGFCEHRLKKHKSRVFLTRFTNKPTAVVCSVRGMRELLHEKSGEEACLLRLSLSSIFTGACLESWSNDIPEEQPQLYQEITQLCTQHWHGLISAPVSVKVPMWSSGFSMAQEARGRLMDIIKDKLENDKQGFVGSLGTLPLPHPGCASQHLLLFISALIPKALASLLTSFTLALSGTQQEQTRQRAREEPEFFRCVLLEVQRLWPPFIGGRRIANKDTTIEGFAIPQGHVVMYVSHAVHRDPEVFQQPNHFLPDRWTGRNAGQEHLLCCLGNGPRNCIGAQLTDNFVKTACSYLLTHYDWTLDPPEQNTAYKWLPVSRPAEPLHVSFTRLDPTGAPGGPPSAQ